MLRIERKGWYNNQIQMEPQRAVLESMIRERVVLTMICVDKSIKQFILNEGDANCQDTRIFDGVESSVTGVGYDLRTKQFCFDANHVLTECILDPGEGVFVAAEETVQFGRNMLGRVHLKNGRLRQGLSLEAPVYQPGHKSRIFFRIRNVSANRITLKAGESYAMLVFEQLEDQPENTYGGTFTDEDIFKGLAGYSAAYGSQIEEVGGKLEKMEKIEERTYTNVSVLLTIFIGIFTLLNVNITLAQQTAGLKNFIMFNAGTLSAIGFLIAMVNEIMQKDDKRQIHWIWFVPIICAGIAALAGGCLA